MYRVAVIQNDGEMMRYSWSDIRPMVSSLGYNYDNYTAENIENLFTKLDKYDAIILATNACNDTRIKSTLESHTAEINLFLSRGRGYAVLFQMKKDDKEFFDYLTEDFRVKTVKRTEDLKSGLVKANTDIPLHPILCYPHKIDINDIQYHCLNNKHVKGLYWTYLQPEKSEKYIILIEDDSYKEDRRPLLIASKEDHQIRIVISAIALDWQGHSKLWENAIRYAVEGKTNLALITKSKSNNYDYRYLTSWLRVNKIPFHLYSHDDIRAHDIEFSIHSIYILDPNFSEYETNAFIGRAAPFIDEGKAEILFFSPLKFPKPYIGAISNTRQFQSISQNAIVWIKSQFPVDHGYFARSFWNTVDVLTTLIEFNESVEPFKSNILAEIAKHDRGGCYDEVLGATCAMLEVYNIYLGAQHEKTLTTVQWIFENLQDKVLFERATALDVLIRLNYHVDDEIKEKFKEEVLNTLKEKHISEPVNEFQLFRYCHTLFTCGYENDALDLALSFREVQDIHDGKWINVSHTAAVVELLIKIQNKANSNTNKLDEMIFRGVEYLYDSYNSEIFSWNNDILSTTKSLRALKLFENRVSLPIDVIKTRIAEELKRVSNFSAIDIASKQIVRYSDDNAKLEKQISILQNLNGEISKSKEVFRKILLFILPAFFGLFLVAISAVYIVTESNRWGTIGVLIKENTGKILTTCSVFCLWIIILFLNEKNLIPEGTPPLIKKIIARIVPGPGFKSKENDL